MKSVAAVRSVAEGLVFGHPTAAQRNYRPAREAEVCSFKIRDSKIALYTNGAVSQNGYLSWHPAMVTDQPPGEGTYNDRHARKFPIAGIGKYILMKGPNFGLNRAAIVGRRHNLNSEDTQ
ncbi:MAG TPA: hypothetical protein VMZ52_13970 [Bryobacteraceae bacterium]|nr:hypothetical protein [Bryobacteraceae bacterium]